MVRGPCFYYSLFQTSHDIPEKSGKTAVSLSELHQGLSVVFLLFHFVPMKKDVPQFGSNFPKITICRLFNEPKELPIMWKAVKNLGDKFENLGVFHFFPLRGQIAQAFNAITRPISFRQKLRIAKEEK